MTLTRCPQRFDGKKRGAQCGLPAGHGGFHTLLIPSGVPWEATAAPPKSGKSSRVHRPIPPHAEVTTPEVAPSAPRDDATLHAERTVTPRPKGTRAHRPRPTEETR